MPRRVLAFSVIFGLFLTLSSVSSPTGIAVAQGTPASSPCADLANDELRAFVQSWGDAIANHDVDALSSMVANDVIRDVPIGSDAGPADVAQTFQRFFAAYPDLSLSVNLVLVDTPLAVVHYTATGTQAIPFAGSDPTGVAATWDGMYFLRVECGQIAEMWTDVDQLSQRNRGTSAPVPTVAPDEGTPASCPSLTEESATALMDTWYNDVWTGKIDQLSAITTSDVYHHWAVGTDTSGHDAQLEHLEKTLSMIAGLSSDYDAIIVDGNYIAVHWEQSLGADAWDGVNIFSTECGLIDEVWSEMNLNDLPAQPEATPAA